MFEAYVEFTDGTEWVSATKGSSDNMYIIAFKKTRELLGQGCDIIEFGSRKVR